MPLISLTTSLSMPGVAERRDVQIALLDAFHADAAFGELANDDLVQPEPCRPNEPPRCQGRPGARAFIASLKETRSQNEPVAIFCALPMGSPNCEEIPLEYSGIPKWDKGGAWNGHNLFRPLGAGGDGAARFPYHSATAHFRIRVNTLPGLSTRTPK